MTERAEVEIRSLMDLEPGDVVVENVFDRDSTSVLVSRKTGYA